MDENLEEKILGIDVDLTKSLFWSFFLKKYLNNQSEEPKQ